MSLERIKPGIRTGKAGIIVAGAAVVVIGASALVPTSGAFFTDTKHANITASTAKAGLVLRSSDADVDSDGSVNLAVSNLKPGEETTFHFSATNTSSYEGELSIQTDGINVSGGNNPDLSKLHFRVDGREDGLLDNGGEYPYSVGRIGINDNLLFSITVSLDASAGDEWQGVTAFNPLSVTIGQPRG